MSTTADIYYDPYDFSIDTDPYPVWKRLRDEAPVYHNEKYDFYALSRFADVEAASKDWETFSSARGVTIEMIRAELPKMAGLFIGEDPPEHDMHRKILSRAVTPKRVKQLDGSIRDLCAEYLDPHVGSDRFEVVQSFAANLPMRVIGALVGVPEEFQLEIREYLDSEGRLEDEEMPDGNFILTLGEPYRPFLEYRRKHPADDFISDLIAARFTDVFTGKERHLSDEEILNYVGQLNGAGNETTARLIGWTVKVLAEHPDARAQLVADPSLIPNAIEEMLRFEAPSPIQGRYVTKEVELHGEVIPEGSVVALLTAAANRDERRFEDPDTYDPLRSSGLHLTFGYGVHFCFGAALARIEGRLALEELLKRFPTWDVDLSTAELVHTSTVRGYEKLDMVL
jgi:cytochrome P450